MLKYVFKLYVPKSPQSVIDGTYKLCDNKYLLKKVCESYWVPPLTNHPAPKVWGVIQREGCYCPHPSSIAVVIYFGGRINRINDAEQQTASNIFPHS